MWSWLWTPTLVVRGQLPLGWHTYLLFKSDVVNFVGKADEGEARSIILLIFLQTSLVGEGRRGGAESLMWAS